MEEIPIAIVGSFLLRGIYLRMGGTIGKTWQEVTLRSSKILRWLLQGIGIAICVLGLSLVIRLVKVEFWGDLAALVFILGAYAFFWLIPYLKEDPERFPYQLSLLGLHSRFSFLGNPLLSSYFITRGLVFFAHSALSRYTSLLNLRFSKAENWLPLAIFYSGLMIIGFADYIVWGWPFDPPKRSKRRVTTPHKKPIKA